MGIKAVDERVVQFRIGVMVLSTLIITVIMMLFFGQGQEFLRIVGINRTYTIYIDFPEAPGVAPKTPIRKSGIRIGQVTKVELKDEGGVRVTAEIDNGRNIFTDETPRLTRSLLTNDAVIEFSRDTSRPTGQPAGQPSSAAPADRAAAAGGPVSPIAEVPAAPHEIPVILTAFQMSGAPPAPSAPDAPPAPSKPQAPREKIPPGTEIPNGQVVPDVMKAVDRFSQLDFKAAIDALTKAGNSIDNFIDESRPTMASLKGMADGVSAFVEDPVTKKPVTGLSETLRNMNNTFTNMNGAINKFTQDLYKTDEQGVNTVEHIRQAAQGMDKFTHDLNEKDQEGANTVDHISQAAKGMQKFTQDLYRKDEKGLNVVDHLSEASRNLADLTQELAAFSHAMNDDSGSLGQLVHKRDLYDRLNTAAGNMQDLTVQLQPILHDARVFSDKIAQHPEILGVRGAIKPSLGGKGPLSLPPLGGSPESSPDPYQDGRQLRFDR
jgi:phospholipid/cholesterol/gamma-HCH transport system substrate-binding protein